MRKAPKSCAAKGEMKLSCVNTVSFVASRSRQGLLRGLFVTIGASHIAAISLSCFSPEHMYTLDIGSWNIPMDILRSCRLQTYITKCL